MHGPIALLVSDPAVLSSLQFALSVEGYRVGAAGDEHAATALVIDQNWQGDGIVFLLGLRAKGASAPGFVLATHPTSAFRARAASADAVVIEKPLLGDELSSALAQALQPRKAA